MAAKPACMQNIQPSESFLVGDNHWEMPHKIHQTPAWRVRPMHTRSCYQSVINDRLYCITRYAYCKNNGDQLNNTVNVHRR